MKRIDIETLKEHIDKLDHHEQSQLFNIIQKYTAEFTHTEKGVLVQASVLSDKCLQEMKSYVSFCQDQKKRMDEDMNTRMTYERLSTKS
jgi:hypothetical protein